MFIEHLDTSRPPRTIAEQNVWDICKGLILYRDRIMHLNVIRRDCSFMLNSLRLKQELFAYIL